MTTLTITLDDSPEAQLIIQLLRQATVVTSVEENSPAAAADSLPPICQGNTAEDPTELFGRWQGRPRTLVEIRQRDWEGRHQEAWQRLRATPDWLNQFPDTAEER